MKLNVIPPVETYTDKYRRKWLAGMLYALGAVKKGNFTLSSGKTSEWYIDGRLATLDPKTLLTAGTIMGEIISTVEFDSIGCMEGPGSISLLGSLLTGYAAGEHKEVISGFVVRKQIKSHGTSKMIEGVVGNAPVLIDDVATSGKSLLHAMDHMQVQPIMAVVMINRNEGAAEALRERGVELRSVLTIDDLVL